MSRKVGHLELDGVKYYPRPSFPVGYIIMTNKEINPSEEFGGEWEIYSLANGRTLVGVDPNDSSFNEVEKRGGSKELHRHSHTGTTAESGWHTHSINWWLLRKRGFRFGNIYKSSRYSR